MSRVDVSPEILTWALERSRKDVGDLPKPQCARAAEWLRGESQPTMSQLRKFASATATPLGYLFLPDPPKEPLPIPDFRTLSGRPVERPSANLLETLYSMQRRSEWLRETLIEEEADPLPFVGSARLSDAPESVAREMRRALEIGDGWASGVKTWTDAVSELRRSLERLGIIAVINGVVENNTHRKLDVNEFRGFALCDEYAPLVFVNGADFKSAQMFTLAHEIAHIWLGREGLSGFEGIKVNGGEVERFSDAAAAEFLVPAHELEASWPKVKRNQRPYHAIARAFKVSPIVAARRAWDLNLIDREDFFSFYNGYVAEEHKKKKSSGGGGDFYNNQNTRVGVRFATEVIRAAKEGRIQYREAYDLTGLHGKSFDNYVKHLGFDVL